MDIFVRKLEAAHKHVGGCLISYNFQLACVMKLEIIWTPKLSVGTPRQWHFCLFPQSKTLRTPQNCFLARRSSLGLVLNDEWLMSYKCGKELLRQLIKWYSYEIYLQCKMQMICDKAIWPKTKVWQELCALNWIGGCVWWWQAVSLCKVWSELVASSEFGPRGSRRT